MRRWLVGFGLVLLACIPILAFRASGPELLQDSDTAVLLSAIREKKAPFSWFVGDWPLQNHFYRPISTLSFELDNALYGTEAAGYGLTQALLSIACVIALFWLVRELTDQPWMATSTAALFAFWHYQGVGWMRTAMVVLGLVGLAAMLLPKRTPIRAVMGFLVCWTAAAVVLPMADVGSRVVAWLPGRTASIMALFALVSIAAYVRCERLSAQRMPAPDPTPLDPPATKGTQLQTAVPKAPWVWMAVSALGMALAFGSYEQAVMLPACFLIVAVALRAQRYRVRWAWQAVAWGMLLAYLALRQIVLPSDVSGYQAQQFRSGPGVWLTLSEYLFPAWPSLFSGLKGIGMDVYEVGGVVGLIATFPATALLGFVSNLATYWEARRDWLIPATALLLSFVSFLPMAWLKHFDHYHYWPMAFRALLAISLIAVAAKAVASAVSLPAMKAPQRPDPALGSLLHP